PGGFVEVHPVVALGVSFLEGLCPLDGCSFAGVALIGAVGQANLDGLLGLLRQVTDLLAPVVGIDLLDRLTNGLRGHFFMLFAGLSDGLVSGVVGPTYSPQARSDVLVALLGEQGLGGTDERRLINGSTQLSQGIFSACVP